jgi:UDP-N-acetylglucosamine 4,6-dehydratase
MSAKRAVVLVTGGAGAIGSAIVAHFLNSKENEYLVRVFDSDEYAIWKLQQHYKGNKNIRFFLGSVREYARIKDAMYGADYVIHCAAYKHVALCEYNPFDAVETNVLGTQNTIRAAFEISTIKKLLYISTDKAVNPTSLMGATKLIGERLILAANYIKGTREIRLSAVRFPNVIQTRGNVFEAWENQLKKDGRIQVTDSAMTRYFIPIERAVEFVMESFQYMKGGEIFIPGGFEKHLRKVIDVAKEWLDQQSQKGEIFLSKPEFGEKFHEALYTEAEASFLKKISPTLSVIEPPRYDFVKWEPS